MQVAVRPYFNAGFAFVGASVIAAAPIAAPPTHMEVPKVVSAAVDLVASVNPIEAYGQFLSNTINNTGALAGQAFANGVAPLLQQFIVNQLTLAQGLNSAFNEVFSSSNPSGLPAILQTALSQLASGQVQAAAETIATGVIQVAFPFLPPLLQPLNNFVAVINQLPNIALVAGIGLISPPLALLQAAGAAVQSVITAISAGDIGGVIGAVLSAPAVMLDGFINGYAPSQTGGLLTPGLGTLSILVNIRDMIVQAITPAPLATTTAAPTLVTLDVATAKTAADETAAPEKTAASTEATAATEATTAASATETTGAATTPATASTEEATTAATATEVKTDTTTPDATKADEAKADATGATDAKAGNDTTKGDNNTGKADADAKADTAKAGTETKAGADAKASTDSKSSDSGTE